MPRVLVVDDQADVRTMISIVLRIHRFEIVEAENAAAALKLFEESSFDLAIVDIFLQGTNGSELITTLRGRVPGPPVVAISGMTALDFLSEASELSGVVCAGSDARDRGGAGIAPAIGRCRAMGFVRHSAMAFMAAPSGAAVTARRVAGHCPRQPRAAKPDRRRTAVAAGGP